MKLVIVVSEFPKLTETFAYRDAVEYERRGHDVRLFHIKRFRKGEIVHDFMRPLAARAFTFGYASPAALAALAREAMSAPLRTARLVLEVLRAYRADPKSGLAVIAYLPKALALGRWCRRNGVGHIHAEFAGHPATAAMIASRAAAVGFSFSAHAHDIFLSQALLADKAREAAFVRAISRYNMAFLAALPGFPVEKLRLVRCGVSRGTLTANGPAPPGDGPLRILYVGALLERKGVRHLLDALAALPPALDWRARIIGGGDCAAALAGQARRLGLESRVRFEGPQPAEAAARAFRESHVAVVPSVVGERGRMEGIPVVAMEAMAHGLPVIASALSGIPELIEDRVTGRLAPPGDAAAIAAALVDIWSDWPAAAAMGARGRERIADTYIVEDNAGALLRLMEEAA